ncbi:MAG: cupin-like domain-containing protein, partial [Brevundimonas sp.]
MSPLPSPRPLPRLRGVDRARFEAEIVPAGRPVVLEGLVADWPAVAAGQTPKGLRSYLAGLDAGRPVQVFRAAPEVQGRYSYSDDLKGRNHGPVQMGLTTLLDEMLALAGESQPASVYAGGVPAPLCLPGLAEANPMP